MIKNQMMNHLTLENKDEDKDIKLRKKVLSKYGKKKDYSFFEDAITN